MTIVAFLQNMWVRDPERVRRMISDAQRRNGSGEDVRQRFLAYSLFAGCLTGRRLRAAFGEELCAEIIWEETTREIADNPKTIFPADPGHIQTVLARYRPGMVLAFGKIAMSAVSPFYNGLEWDMITAPHPAARQADVLAKLKKAAGHLHEAMKTAKQPKLAVGRHWCKDLMAAPKGVLLELKYNGDIYRGYRYANTDYFTAGLGYLWASAWRLLPTNTKGHYA